MFVESSASKLHVHVFIAGAGCRITLRLDKSLAAVSAGFCDLLAFHVSRRISRKFSSLVNVLILCVHSGFKYVLQCTVYVSVHCTVQSM